MLPKYCNYCGKKLIKEDLGIATISYDQYTGKPIDGHKYKLTCPDFKYAYYPEDPISPHYIKTHIEAVK